VPSASILYAQMAIVTVNTLSLHQMALQQVRTCI
jgi:hypothetical protein